jgi:hypothetical protein
MTLEQVIQDIHTLTSELETFEKKYAILSEDFYRLYLAGELRDEEPEEIQTYGKWAAFYETRQHRLELYHRAFAEWLNTARASAPTNGLTLHSHAHLAEA